MDTADVLHDTAPQKHNTPVIRAVDLGLNNEHGALFHGIDLEAGAGLQVLQIPAGPAQNTLLLTLAGRMRPSHGDLTVLEATSAHAIRRKCAVAGFEGVDELDEYVTVQTVLAEQSRWIAPWYSLVPLTAGQPQLEQVFGPVDTPEPKARIGSLTDVQHLLLRVTLALLSNRPVLFVSDLEQVRDDHERAQAVERLHAIAGSYTVVIGATNPLGPNAPSHTLHDLRTPDRKD